jgi:hypothetical protein
MQHIITGIIIALAIGAAIWKLAGFFRSPGRGCGCTPDKCARCAFRSDTCSDPENPDYLKPRKD